MNRAEGPRISGGTARGARLFGIPGRDVRPALARMRISVFEILRARLEGARVADLFAGTGCLGLEALSRGAAHATFLDVDDRSLDAIRRNLAKLRFEGRADVARADAFAAAERLEPVDLAFVDPPYDFYLERADAMRRLVETLVARGRPDGLVLVEHRPRQGLGDVAGARLDDERVYGGTVVTFYARA